MHESAQTLRRQTPCLVWEVRRLTDDAGDCVLTERELTRRDVTEGVSCGLADSGLADSGLADFAGTRYRHRSWSVSLVQTKCTPGSPEFPLW